MSHVEPNSTIPNTSNPAQSIMPNGKTTAAAPKLSDDDHVELKDMLPSGPLPEEDIMQLARVGDIASIEKLYESGKFEPTYCDHEGITPLHVTFLCLTLCVLTDLCCSGLLSTINMQCANIS
jgi:ankyrin repeat protein